MFFTKADLPGPFVCDPRGERLGDLDGTVVDLSTGQLIYVPAYSHMDL